MKLKDRLLHALGSSAADAALPVPVPVPVSVSVSVSVSAERRGARRFDTDRPVSVRRWGGVGD